MLETIYAKGHHFISAKHKTTIEITTEDFLTPRGDCIVAISADKALSGLSEELKQKLRKGKQIKILIECGNQKDIITGYGNKELSLSDKSCMVIRKSSYICNRTLCINADKAAAELDEKLVKELQKGKLVKIGFYF